MASQIKALSSRRRRVDVDFGINSYLPMRKRRVWKDLMDDDICEE